MKDRFKAFAGSITQLSRYIQRIKNVEMKKIGLRANHTMCLYYLGKHEEGLTSAQLTQLSDEDKSTVSRCLAQLIKRGLVTCEVPENKRSYRTLHFLTDEGREVVKKVNNKVEDAMNNGGDGLTEEQRNTFYQSMDTILKNLSRYLKREKNPKSKQ